MLTLFSGGLDSSYLLLRLRELGFEDVHALFVDIGGTDSLAGGGRIAEALGARLHDEQRHHVFADEFVAPAIRAHGSYLDTHPVSSSLSRPLIAQAAMHLASSLGPSAILHTANRSQNTLRRLNGALRQLGCDVDHGSPYDLEPVSREAKLDALARAGIVFSEDRSYSGDSNLWCREFESGALDDPEHHPVPESLYRWSAVDPETAASGRTEDVAVSFENGTPVAVDGAHADLASIVAHLNARVGAFGLGRHTGLEHLDGDQKVLEVREMPAAWLILRSRRHLEGACLPSELLREKLGLEHLWAREAIEGRWFGPTRHAAQAFVDDCSTRVAGTVGWTLRVGGATTRSIAAERPMYLRDRERWEHRAVAAESITTPNDQVPA